MKHNGCYIYIIRTKDIPVIRLTVGIHRFLAEIKKQFLLSCIILLIINMLLIPSTVFADEDELDNEKFLNISTFETRPISIDRLLYMALKDMGYQLSLTDAAVQTGFDMANEGDTDGVVSFYPDFEKDYPNLRKVHIVLEKTNIYAFTRDEGKIEINNWKDLSGLKVGVLVQRTYIHSQIPDNAILIEKETNSLALDALYKEEVDVVVLSQRSNETISLPNGIIYEEKLETQKDYLYLNKKYEKLIPKITRALRAIFKDGRGEKILEDMQIPEINSKKTILHIISSSTEITREEQFNEVIRNEFENDMTIEWHKITLDTQRFSRDTSRLDYISSLLRQDCVSKNVAAIVVSGDDALKFLKEHYYIYFRNVPVLFYGVCDSYKEVIKGYEMYFTGLVEHLEAYETINTAISLFPNTKKLYVLNDFMTEGMHYRSIIEEQLKPFEEIIDIEYNNNLSIEEILEDMEDLPEDSMVLVGSYLCDANGQYYHLNEMRRLIESSCDVPVFSIYSTKPEYDAIGGKCLDYSKYGQEIANMLKDVLNGKDIFEIPIIYKSPKYSRWVFDKTNMDIFGIGEDELPVNAEIINKIPSIWESNPQFAITLVILLLVSIGVVIGISIFMLQRRRQKERLISGAKIQEVKERLERIIGASPVLFLIAIDGTIVEINDNMYKETGLNIGDHILRIYEDPSMRKVYYERVINEGILRNEIIKFIFMDGKVHRCLVNVATADYEGQTAVVLWALDIEESEKQNDQINNARQSLQTILDTMPAAVRIIDNESAEITYANNACITMFGYKSLEDMQKNLIHNMIHSIDGKEVDKENINKIVNDILEKDESFVMEVKYFTFDGGIIDTRITSCSIDYEGRKSTLTIMQDLTAEKEYQQMLNNTAEKEREANQLKSRFLVNMSHEIRTPMNAIMGLTEIELRKKQPRETKDIYLKIKNSAKNLLDIINDILDLSKIEADKIELFEEEFELEEVLNSALLVASPRLDGKNVEFMFNASLELPRYVIGDKTRLWQILKNFLDNSAKYTDEGKIILTVYGDKSKSSDEVAVIHFVIEDTGIGISEEQINRIFLPYEQIYNQAQKKYTGTGLGMAISKQLCEIMGGNLQVESHINKGTTISFSIPFKRSKNNETGLQAVKTPFLNGLKILAVDDDKLSLEIMEGLLKNNNVECITAHNGFEAMKIILKHRDEGEAFDVILLDYMMEGLNGLETARQIHLSLSQAPKVLMVTAYQKLLIKSELEKNGIDDVIEKPFMPSQFVSKLCEVLGYEIDNDKDDREVYTRFKDVEILLCEDYRLNQEVALGMFSQFGIKSTIAENGKQGIEILNSGKEFDLIFMDLQMPIMDGYEATRIIRSDSRFDHIPIISLTADAMKEVADKCLEIGMNDHIEKPIEFEQLHRVFCKWLPESKRDLDEEAWEVKATGLTDALSRFGGDEERYNNALSEFAQLIEGEWQDFDSLSENLEKNRQYIHKIKGAAGNLSEKDIYNAAIEFEESFKNSKPDKLLYEQLINICKAARKRILEKTKEIKADTLEHGSEEEFKVLIMNFKEALQEYDPRACSQAVKLLKEKTWMQIDEFKLHQSYELALKYEFDAALDVLDKIMEEKDE